MVLEAGMHKENSFVTLTYAPEHLPPGGTLIPDHLSGFMKRLRARFPLARSVRFFGVGEYGGRFGRPHYHLILFGLGQKWAGLIEDCWRFGRRQVLPLSRELAQYICGYTLKKMTKKEDKRLRGLAPEFVRMSRRPGIGALAVGPVADALGRKAGGFLLSVEGDIPYALQHGRQLLPLDRYMRDEIRKELGLAKVDFKGTKTGIKQKAELQLLFASLPSITDFRGEKVKHPFADFLLQGELERQGRVARSAYKMKRGNYYIAEGR